VKVLNSLEEISSFFKLAPPVDGKVTLPDGVTTIREAFGNFVVDKNGHFMFQCNTQYIAAGISRILQ
jgi:hypothetical protein